MAVFNASKREIDIKIVYYGPALCGKTTNIQTVHQRLNPNQRGDIVSLATKDDRTLFFDFLPIELGNVKGFRTRFHVYTVPGQVYYALTRRAVLTGVDGIVFVADSQKSKMEENKESLSDLLDNLKYYKKDISTIPFILQYNKRDLQDISTVEELNKALNTLNSPSFEACATQGQGVMETLTTCCKLVLNQMGESSVKKDRAEQEVIPSSPVQRDTTSREPSSQYAYHEEQQLNASTLSIGKEVTPPLTSQEPSELIKDTLTSLKMREADASLTGEKQTLSYNVEESYKQTEFDKKNISLDEEESPRAHEGLSTSYDSQGNDMLVNIESETPPISSEQLESSPHISSHPQITFENRTDFKIVACGQPKKHSDTSIKIPLIFKIEPLNQECMISITLSFEDFVLKTKH